MTKKIIDYYGYWNEKRQKSNFLLDREIKSLWLISRAAGKASNFLDVGCGNGKFMKAVLSRFPGIQVKGVDYSKSEVAEARKYGLDVREANLEEGIKFKSNSFDVVYAGEVIEHLYNPDKLLEEVNRITKKGGFLVLTTPNLCAWFNRILLPLGIQPLFLEPSTVSKLVGAGLLKRFKKEPNPVGHIRIFTFEALKDLLEINGFKIEIVSSAIFDEGLPKQLLLIDRLFNLFPTMASHLVILAKKIR